MKVRPLPLSPERFSALDWIRDRFGLRAARPLALTPPDTVIYAIGDIHACHKLLARLLVAMVADAAKRRAQRRVLVCLGDYVSRGASSRRVVERLIEGVPGFETVMIKGNHEDVLLRFLDGDMDAARNWFDHDGMDTLEHYGIAVPNREVRGDAALEALRRQFIAALPPAHLAFFRGLRLAYAAGDYFFTHGGVRPGVPLDEQRGEDLMWIRREFLESEVDHGAVVVHGHSISARPQRRFNRIGIDTGAYRSGVLTCLVVEGSDCEIFQT
jgi:serine/threonine protein phosphatase 1